MDIPPAKDPTPIQPNPPPPADDPAARFRKPGDAAPSPAAAAPKEAPKPPRPQSFGRMLEETLVAPFRLGSLFDELAQEPVPGFGLLLANVAVYWLAMIGLNLVYVAIARPEMLRVPQEYLVGVGVAALLAILVGPFVLAGALEAVALAAGASSDYARSFQLLALLSAIAPLQAAASWLPQAWPAPLLLGALCCASGLERLRKAPALGARLVVFVVAGASLGLVYTARRAAERVIAPYAQLQEAAEQLQNSAAQAQQVQPAQTGGPAPATGASSLDLLRSGALANPGGPQAQQLQQIQSAAAGMMGQVTPMLNDPKLISQLPPQQADAMKQISGLLAQQEASLQSGQRVDPKAQQAMLQQLMNAMMQMQQGLPKPTGGTPEQMRQYQQMQQMMQKMNSQMAAPPQAPAQGQQP